MKIDDKLAKKKIKKNDVALSNDVYEYKNWFYKIYSSNSFKEVFQNQDLLILELLKNTKFELKYKIYDDGVATKKIPWEKVKYEDISFEQISFLVKKIIAFNSLESKVTIKSGIKEPGFFRALKLFDSLEYVTEIFSDETTVIELVKTKAFDDIVLCHNDLISDNIFFSETISHKEKLKFIDFEYAGLINFHFDIAIMMNSWVIDKSKYLLIFNEFKKQYDVDHQYLKNVRIFLLIFWSKLCDYKYPQTNKEIYKELKGIISGFRKTVEEQYIFSKTM